MATDFGKRLAQARKGAKLTQKQLANMVGVAQGTISELEKIGHGSAYTYQLAMACRVHPNWLATGEDGPSTQINQDKLPSPLAMELAWLFDDIVQGMGPKERSRVYQAAQEAITREPAPRGALPSDTPAPLGFPERRRG